VSLLLAQDYNPLEILVLDDHSSDGTGELVRAFHDPRVRVIRGSGLPEGWGGKNWACWQLAQVAQGEILVFTDADVQWQAGAVQAVINQMSASQADLLTVWSTQITETWGERLVVPLMALVILGYLPALGVYHTPFASLAAANGQCLAFRRKAYEAVGGHAAVKGSIIEDIRLARKVKAQGMKLDMADGAGLLMCRMYRGWREVRDGYAKNILAGYGNSFLFLGMATVFHWLVFLMPPLWLLFGWLNPALDYPRTPLLLTVLGLLIRALTAAVTQQRVGDALIMPISVLLMTRIAAQSVYWAWRYGGPQWKGRTISHKAEE
jgi:chlorobactene glucosyltransferase